MTLDSFLEAIDTFYATTLVPTIVMFVIGIIFINSTPYDAIGIVLCFPVIVVHAFMAVVALPLLWVDDMRERFR